MGSLFGGLFSIGLFTMTLRMATPLIFTAIGGLMSERSGVINIGLEGMMLMGAFGAAFTALLTGNPYMGIAIAGVTGGLMALIHAVMCIRFRANQPVIGLGINIMAMGVPALILFQYWGNPGRSPQVEGLPVVTIPLIRNIPVIGGIIGRHSPLTYAALLLVPVAHYLLFKTKFGLHIRAVGEHPRAADTVGINVFAIRYVCVILSGVLAGFGGAYLSLSQMSMFSSGMTAGRGFIALAAMIFGKRTPLGAFGAALLFGFASGLQMAAQSMNLQIPHNFLLMIPYILTMIALSGFIGKTKDPGAIGQPYEKH